MSKELKMRGVEKAAILLMNIGEELASEVFKHMSTAEMQLLGGSIVRKDTVSAGTGRKVVDEFVQMIDKGEIAVEGLAFAKNLIIKSLGPEKAKSILDKITRDMETGGIESLKWLDPAIVANIIKNEHPQIIALILTHLEPERAAQVLLNIPEERQRGEIMLRVANLKRIPKAAVKDLELLLSETMLSEDSGEGSAVEGIKVAAEILNQVETNAEGVIMEMLESSSPDLAAKVQDKMFVFADLLTIDSRGIQALIKDLSTELLSMALKGSDEGIKDKFLGNMSERGAEMLAEDIEAKGPVKLSDVERAQQEIIKIARRLEQEGKLVRAGRGGEVFI